MEENLMEKLLNDFNGTLEQFNELVRNNDYDGVKRVLDEVNRLLQERNGIVLDDREPQYDHVLHELLDKMTGVVEKITTVEGIDGVPGTRYYTNEQVREMIAEAERELEEITRMVETYKDVNPEAYAQARSDRSAIIARISDLKAALVEGQEFSTLTYIDPRLAELQEERARLLKEKAENLKEIARLRAEETPGIPDSPADQERLEEINKRLSELEGMFSDIEGQIGTIRETKISELIERLRTETTRVPELEARRNALQEELRRAADRVRETRGFDEQNAQARADYSAIVSQISNLDSELGRVGQNEENITFLESLLPEVEQKEDVLDPMDYTYMGRLSDEQIIRRLLSEQLHLSEEEINATIGEYSLEQAEPGAHDENGEDNPISMRRLVRTQKVKGQLAVKEGIEKLDQEIAELQARRAALQEELRKAGDRVRETRGFDEQNAQARADYSDLVRQISELDAQITSVRARQTRIKEISGIKAEEDKINAAKAEKEELLNKKKELEKDSERPENPEVRAKIDKLKEISGIAALEAELKKYREEYERLQKEKEGLVGTKGKPGIDNSEKIAALEARNREIDARIAEIDKEIEGMTGVVHTSTKKETLDVEKEAHRIGDHIFKTAAIRRELALRNVTRDEFLAFYQAGLDKTNEQIDKLSEEYQKYLAEIKTVLTDPENPTKRIDVLMKEAEKAGDTELVAKLAEKMRKNFISTGREEQLKAAGLDHEITSAEDVEKLKQFYRAYQKSVEKGAIEIKSSVEELKENAGIFSKEIERIKAEKATIELAGKSSEELESKVEERKKVRRALLEASITPEKDLTEEQKELLQSWQDASERFLSKKNKAKYLYVDKDGVEHVIDVDSIDSTYPEYARDIEFLGVPAYKENLEQISAWEQTKDPYVFGEEVGKAYEAAEAEREGAGAEVLGRILADKQKYVETFNGIPNPHKVKYENWKTAGSTLKGMKPVSRDLPITTRAKNITENVFRFLGIRAPKFTRKDEHGNDVRDIKGGAATLALDALVVGGVGLTAATVGPAVVAIGYAAKGIVTVGNRVAARIEYARHKDEIDSNKPVINQADSNAREVARKHYYRDQGDNRFVSWVKAKSDKYFTRKRGKATEAAIVEKLASEYSEAEDKRTEALKENLEIAQANQLARLKRQTQIAMSANTYNDIVRDPDSVDMDAATAAIARNAALEANKPGSGREDVNAASTETRKEQYVKEEKPVDKTSDLGEIPEGEAATTGPVSAITAEQIYTGRKQHVDRLNRVLTVITAAGLKFGYTAWKDGFMKEDVIHHDAVTKDEVVHHDAEYGEVEVKDFEQQFDTSKTLEELRKNYAGKTADEYYSVSGGLRGQRTEPLVDREITAGWFDDNTTWGTGVSDAQGLTAPVLTDRLADAGLLDANGVLRQDITVQELLDVMGCKNPDLTSLDGIYMSVGDRYWVGLSDLMKGMTRNVEIGSHIETQLIKDAWDETVQTVVTPAWDETVKTFAPGLMVDALKDGAIIGAGAAVADALHEAAQNTYIDGATPGRPEEVTPEANDTFEMMAKKIFEKAEKEAELNRKAEEEVVEEAEEERE